MTTATTAQIDAINHLRKRTNPTPDRDQLQASVESVAHAIQTLVMRVHMRVKGKDGGRTRPEWRQAHPASTWHTQAHRIRDIEWAAELHDRTVDPATLTTSEACSLIDRLKYHTRPTISPTGLPFDVVRPELGNMIDAMDLPIIAKRLKQAQTELAAEAPDNQRRRTCPACGTEAYGYSDDEDREDAYTCSCGHYALEAHVPDDQEESAERRIVRISTIGETLISHDTWNRLVAEKDEMIRRSTELLDRAEAEADATRAQEWEDLSDHYGQKAARLRERLDEVLATFPTETSAEQDRDLDLLAIKATAHRRKRLDADLEQAQRDIRNTVRRVKNEHGDEISAYKLAQVADVSPTAVANWLKDSQ